ncbi:hypothetical protein niasHT_004943 [Heterodera trifolii]|uniref:Uncharacterized protein n=1 Tax=Heterodera trifolii TaxID=157864 RepID=A0ABD2MBU6_9BILA
MDQQDHNKEPPKRDQQDLNKETPKKDQEDEEETKEPSWISLIDEEQKQDPFTPIYDEPPRASTPKTCACAERPRPIPLVEHLCKRFNCSAHELHVLFRNLEKRRDIVEHLRSAQLRTAHLRPFVRNFPVRCNDLSILDAHSAPAYRGFLGITFLAIAQRGVNTEYNPRRFHAIIMRIRYGAKTVAALIFQSARVVLTGVPHPDQAHKFAARVLRRIQYTQCRTMTIYELRVVNIVGVLTFDQRIRVEKLQQSLGGIYDPTIFPALRCELDNGTTCLIYISGKVILTGVKNVETLQNSFDYLSKIVPNYFR